MVGAVEETQRPGDHGHREARIQRRVELDQPHAVGRSILARPRDLDREAGLADPTGAGQGEQPDAVEQPVELGELALASDEAREAVGKVASASTGDPQSRELRPEARRHDLEELLGYRNVAK